jgi:hypothetical protein
MISVMTGSAVLLHIGMPPSLGLDRIALGIPVAWGHITGVLAVQLHLLLIHLVAYMAGLCCKTKSVVPRVVAVLAVLQFLELGKVRAIDSIGVGYLHPFPDQLAIFIRITLSHGFGGFELPVHFCVLMTSLETVLRGDMAAQIVFVIT